MRVYFIAMSVRILCVASLFFVRGWWILLVGIAAVVLPYFAVLVANQHAPESANTPDAPTPLELQPSESADTAPDAAAQPLLVVDAPADRRATPTPAPGDEDRA